MSLVDFSANGIEGYRLDVGDRIDQVIRETETRYSSSFLRNDAWQGKPRASLSLLSLAGAFCSPYSAEGGRVAEPVFLGKDDAAFGVISTAIA